MIPLKYPKSSKFRAESFRFLGIAFASPLFVFCAELLGGKEFLVNEGFFILRFLDLLFAYVGNYFVNLGYCILEREDLKDYYGCSNGE